MPGNPIKLSETHEEVFTSPPALGEHTTSVLTELLGKSQSEIDEWLKSGVIG
jgi:crotonobetainyl-CoA:carnitine CoA-transferase CaiB-like acyl-CoA transferase